MTSESTPRGWFKATKSGGNGGQCVQVNMDTLSIDDTIRLRDSKNPDVAPFEYSRAEWTALLDGVLTGRCPGADTTCLETEDIVLLYRVGRQVAPFRFTRGEWEAFSDGVSKGEFAVMGELDLV
jgi:hypothetical protein